ncbi:MAG: hypothetical protein OXI95_18400 [bacterium]|nr:hypothetical protein [bacterium]MDE0418884.1 hypothetical protein [bacterium]
MIVAIVLPSDVIAKWYQSTAAPASANDGIVEVPGAMFSLSRTRKSRADCDEHHVYRRITMPFSLCVIGSGTRIRRTAAITGKRGDSLFHQVFNGNKRIITLDLERPRGCGIPRRLAARTDGPPALSQ